MYLLTSFGFLGFLGVPHTTEHIFVFQTAAVSSVFGSEKPLNMISVLEFWFIA